MKNKTFDFTFWINSTGGFDNTLIYNSYLILDAVVARHIVSQILWTALKQRLLALSLYIFDAVSCELSRQEQRDAGELQIHPGSAESSKRILFEFTNSEMNSSPVSLLF